MKHNQQQRPKTKRRFWTSEEIDILLSCVDEFTEESKDGQPSLTNAFVVAASRLPGRTVAQCRNYYHKMNHKLRSAARARGGSEAAVPRLRARRWTSSEQMLLHEAMCQGITRNRDLALIIQTRTAKQIRQFRIERRNRAFMLSTGAVKPRRDKPQPSTLSELHGARTPPPSEDSH